MMETDDIPAEHDDSEQAFLRYLPRRIEAFEQRILRYRFKGWEPSGMMVLGVDLQRLADASDRYGFVDTRQHLLTLAQTVREHIASMRAPDPRQTTRLFALLSAVIKSLPPHPELSTHSTPGETTSEKDVPFAVTGEQEPGPTPAAIAESIAPVVASTFESATPAEPVQQVEPVASAPAIAANAPIDYPVQDALSRPTQLPATSEPAESVATIELPESGEQIATTESAEPVEPGGDGIEALAPATTIATAESTESGARAEETTSSASDESHAPPAPAQSIEPEELDEPDTAGEGGVRRVYHFSDGNAFALDLERHLESEGYVIEPVDSLDELTELLMCLVPQVLLVDTSHVSDLVAIGEARRDVEKRSRPPRRIQMAALAAQDNVDTRRLAHRAGVDLLMFPPFEIAGISERLHVLQASAGEQRMRVLVVDDNRADALYAQSVLSHAGIDAQVEHNPMRVLEALKSLHPDLVLMDLHMPFANGVEVTMLIREHPVFARLPIVFLSGESDPDSQLEAINAGGDDFLFKPIRPRHLIAAVRDRMRRLHPVGMQGHAHVGRMT